MTKKYVASTNEEYFSLDYESIDEAIEVFPQDEGLESGDLFYIGEKVDCIPTVSGNKIVEMLYEDADNQCGEWADDYLDDIKDSQITDLENVLNRTILKFLESNKLMPNFYSVKNSLQHIVK